MNRRAFVVATGALASSFVAGCVGRSLSDVETTAADSQGGNTGTTRAGAKTVGIEAERFDPSAVAVRVGGTVTWENHAEADHTITSYEYVAEAAAWEVDQTIEPGGSYSHTFERKGMYQYYSEQKGTYAMCGVVFVGDAESDWDGPCL